jgi:hypothetical protein
MEKNIDEVKKLFIITEDRIKNGESDFIEIGAEKELKQNYLDNLKKSAPSIISQEQKALILKELTALYPNFFYDKANIFYLKLYNLFANHNQALLDVIDEYSPNKNKLKNVLNSFAIVTKKVLGYSAYQKFYDNNKISQQVYDRYQAAIEYGMQSIKEGKRAGINCDLIYDTIYELKKIDYFFDDEMYGLQMAEFYEQEFWNEVANSHDASQLSNVFCGIYGNGLTINEQRIITNDMQNNKHKLALKNGQQ